MKNIFNYFILLLLFAIAVIVIGKSDTSGKKEQLVSGATMIDTNNTTTPPIKKEEIGEEFYAGKLEDERATKNTTKPEGSGKRTQVTEEKIEEAITDLYDEEEFILREGKRWEKHIQSKIESNQKEWITYIIIRSWLTKELLDREYKWNDFVNDIEGKLEYRWSIDKIMADYPALNKKPVLVSSAEMKFTKRTATKEQRSHARQKAEGMRVGEEVVFKDIGHFWDTGKEIIALEEGYPSWSAYEKKVGTVIAKKTFRERTNIMATRGVLVLTRRKGFFPKIILYRKPTVFRRSWVLPLCLGLSFFC